MKYLLPGVLLLIFSSCLNDPDCLVTATSILKVSLKSNLTKSDTLIPFTKVTISGTDTVLYASDTTKLLNLPVNPHDTQTLFKLYYGSHVDSIQVMYIPENTVISPACGAYIYYRHLTIGASSFGNIKVVNPILSTKATANIEVKL